MSTGHPPTYQVIVIGAGQAGLAAAHGLVRDGLRPGEDFLVLDSNDGPGGAWRHRWESLSLGRAHGVADLPGLPLGTPDPEVPASSVVADYYGRYEDEFDLRIVRPAHVTAVRSEMDGALLRTGPLTVEAVVAGEETTYTTALLINATGTWTQPFIPQVPGLRSFQGEQLHTVNYTRAEDFAGRRTLVVGGGLSAVQFLLELAPLTQTVWATRNPPNFTDRGFDSSWGLAVEDAVRERTSAGLPPVSVVRTTGIPLLPQYTRAVSQGTLVSRGMFSEVTPTGVHFPGAAQHHSRSDAGGLGPSRSDRLVVPESWQPFPRDIDVPVDVIFWNTGFRPALGHLAPLRLRAPGGGIEMSSEVDVALDPRVLLVGYGASASTIGATRAGRRAARAATTRLASTPAEAR